MEIQFLGAAGTVTGSKHLLRLGGGDWLVDCGLYQGLKELRLRNWDPFPVPPESLRGVIATHAHIDHIGYLPRLVRDGLRGDVWGTPGTAKLAGILLPDSGRLQEEEAEYRGRRGLSKHKRPLPLYTEEEGQKAAERFRRLRYDAPLELAPGARATFVQAGHILGSAQLRVEIGDGGERRRIVFSGDLGRYDAPILKDPAPLGEVDYVVMESTYGDRAHDAEPIADKLERIFREAVARGGAVVVPAFAVGRTQELLYHLEQLESAGRVPRLPKYLDSPMAAAATRIYAATPEDFDEEMRELVHEGRSPLAQAEVTTTATVEESRAINRVKGPAIIISASGMATGGRVLHHLRRRLPDPATTVLLVGYQAEGTRGRRLQEGGPTVRIFGEDVPVRAHVETVHGFSAHADADGLLRWLRTAQRPPRRVFLVHGDPEPARVLEGRIRSELGWEVAVPRFLDRFAIE
jgi:metallo-beta-lactamase family protein